MQDSNLKVVDARCSPIGKNPFSWVTDGLLRLRGKFVQANINNDSSGLANVLELESSSDKSIRQSFMNDDRILLNDGEMVYCFLVGSSLENSLEGVKFQYGIVLKRLEGKPDECQRVGTLRVEHCRDWFKTGELGTFDIV